jgi:hypothetical protein
MASTQQSATAGELRVRPPSGKAWEVFLVGVPLVWIVVALVHPQGSGDLYDELRD